MSPFSEHGISLGVGRFSEKLARLSVLPPPGQPGVDAPRAWSPTETGEHAVARRPASLDDLRERIANILARHVPSGAKLTHVPEPDSSRELPFVTEERDASAGSSLGVGPRSGALHLARKRAPLGARVGLAPLIEGASADPSTLALLALDPALASCDPRRALYVDVESTGLGNGAGNVPFLIGIASFDAGSGAFVLEQMFLRRLGEEAPMLSYLRERIEEASMLVSFNGKSFDLPLLRGRAVLSRVGAFPERPHLDLLPVARRLHAHRLASCGLKAIERDVLGLERVGDVSGADIGAIYGHYLRTGDEGALASVVEHNALDVFSMVALVGFYGEPVARHAADEGALARHPDDVGALARVLRRAGRLDEAAAVADYAVDRGGGAASLRVRADVANARGEKAAALADYEALAREADDPEVRLRLAKLYEHHARDFDKALAVVAHGTGERAALAQRRQNRLVTKLANAVSGGTTSGAPSEKKRKGERNALSS